ncbi:hypothetical protein MNV84_04378 [Leishmania braziliensis]|nr:hypothetical protein MNV84_04378 [Leishmania braziliensis]
MCRAALWASISVSPGTLATDHTPPRQCVATSSRPMVSRDWMLHDILVTPLYVCVNSAAVVPLSTNTCLHLVRRLASGGESVNAAEVATAGSADLDTLLRESPTCGTLVYVLLQQRWRMEQCKIPPPLSILDSNAFIFAEGSGFAQHEEALAADVYVSVVPSLSPSTHSSETPSSAAIMQLMTSLSVAHERGSDNVMDCRSEAWAAELSKHILRRWARLSVQVVLCCGESQAALRHRRGLLLRHASDVQRDTTPAFSTSNDAYTRKLNAALHLLDALRPTSTSAGRQICDGGEASCSVVVDALDVVLEKCEDDGSDRHHLLRGCVRRVVAFAPTAAPHCGVDEPRLAPEPDYLQLPWCVAHSAALAFTSAQASAASASTPHFSASSAASSPIPPHVHVPLPVLDACMSDLHFTAEQQTCLHELAYSVVYLASLTFTPQGGSSAGPAKVASTSLPALSAAAKFLRLPTSELVAALTTVEAREDDQSTTSAARHALNCTGATQMQRVLVAHLGGLLVRTLMHLINMALHVDGRIGTDARALVLAATTDAEDTAVQAPPAHMPDTDGGSHGGSGGGLSTWYAAYVRCHAAAAVRDRLVGALQREACYEGVESEVDSWLDKFSAASTAPTSTALRLRPVAAEVREVATRVRMPSAKQREAGTIFTTHATAAAAAYDSVDTTCDIPVVAELARILEAVTLRCSDTDVSAAPPLSSPAAVQRLLAEQLQELAASARQTVAREDDGTAIRAEEVVCTWEGTASADSSPCDGVLVLTFPCGLHSSLRLSVRRLAADIFAAARLCVLGTTPAVQHILHGVREWCASLTSMVISADDRRRRVPRMGQSPLQSLEGGRDSEGVMGVLFPVSSCSAHEALQSTLALHRRSRSPISNIVRDAEHRDTTTATLTSDFFYVMLSIPVPAETSSWGTLPGIGDLEKHRRGSPGALPFLELLPPDEAPMSFTPASNDALTPDDVLTTYLRERDPLLLALFFWSRLCHCHVCPVPAFAKTFAVPLLTSYAQRRPLTGVPPRNTTSSSPSAGESREDALSESALRTVADAASGAPVQTPRWHTRATAPDAAVAEFLNRVRHLQRQARYRELCLLALQEVPCCGDGGAVLGVSVVFLGAAAVATMQSCRVELRDTAVRCLQETGRGFLSRRRLCFVREQRRQQLDQQRHRSLHLTNSCLVDPAAASSVEMREREVLERMRDTQLAQSAQHRINALTDSTRHLSHTVGLLQQGWTETLELLEGELVGSTMQINAYEKQRRVAEDAARQEARLSLRVHEEAWSEVWMGAKRRQAHRQAALAGRQRRRPSPLERRDAESTAVIEEGIRLATTTAHHTSQLRHKAVLSAEAALLSHLLSANRREDAQWLAGHVRRQEARVTHMADRRQHYGSGSGGADLPEERQRRGGRREKGITETPARPAESPAGFSRLQHSNPEGLVFTRPRHAKGKGNTNTAPTSPLGAGHTQLVAVSCRERGCPDVAGRMSIASIERTMTATATEDSPEWVVQRDLMSLWESSRMSA